MRLAKRSRCPKCKQKWAIQCIGWIGLREIYQCRCCDWMPHENKQRVEQAMREAEL